MMRGDRSRPRITSRSFGGETPECTSRSYGGESPECTSRSYGGESPGLIYQPLVRLQYNLISEKNQEEYLQKNIYRRIFTEEYFTEEYFTLCD